MPLAALALKRRPPTPPGPAALEMWPTVSHEVVGKVYFGATLPKTNSKQTPLKMGRNLYLTNISFAMRYRIQIMMFQVQVSD